MMLKRPTISFVAIVALSMDVYDGNCMVVEKLRYWQVVQGTSVNKTPAAAAFLTYTDCEEALSME